MKRSRRVAFGLMFAVAAAFIAPGDCLARESVWEGEGGWTDMAERPKSTAEGLYRRGRALFVRGDVAAAADVFRDVERRFSTTPFATRAKFSRAKCEARRGRYFSAAEICGELLREGVVEISVEEIITEQLAMLREASRMDLRKAAELLHETAERAPTTALKHAACTAEGDARFRLEDYALAASAYAAAYDADSGRPEQQYLALYNAALCALLSCREQEHDEELLRHAQERFRCFLEFVPEGDKADAAQGYLDAIGRILAETEPRRRKVFYAMTYLPEGRYRRAAKIFKRARRKFPGTLADETAYFYYAESRYLQGKLWKAFGLYEDLMEKYPLTVYLRRTVDRQFAIAESMLEQDERNDAMTAFEAVAHNNPNGPLADDARMHVGRLHLAKKKYDKAKEAFETVVEDYPGGEWALAALFQSGLADLKFSELASDNEDRLAKARRAFALYLRQAPDGPFAADARTFLEECRRRQAQELWRIARFYERRRQAQAAAWYDGLLVREHSDSPEAAEAMKNLKVYEEQGLKLP